MLTERLSPVNTVEGVENRRNIESTNNEGKIYTVGNYIASLRGDQDQRYERAAAENLLKDLGLPRETTEKGKKLDAEILNKSIQNLPPERQKIINMLQSYIGTNEKDNTIIINQFHNSAGQNGSSVETAWCMSFVQHILKQSGNTNYKPTLRARDGLKIGKATKNPKPGDLLIVERGGGGGHIGFFVGFAESGNPIIIGGNQGEGEVSIKEETRKILGYRSIV